MVTPTASQVKGEHMRKILLVLVSVLLLAGIASASEWNSSFNAELSAQNTGRAVVTDSSVILQIWYTGPVEDNASVGVSADTVNLYSDGAAGSTVNTSSTSYDTPGEIVDYINGLDYWKAAVGPDSYRNFSVSGAIIASDNAYVGSTQTDAASIYNDASTSLDQTIGVAADATSRIRLKTISQQLASNSDNITIAVYDGNTKIWQKHVTPAVYNSTTASAASTNTVIPTNDDKGLASTKGNSLCVVVTTDGQWDTDAVAKANDQLTITYDKLRD